MTNASSGAGAAHNATVRTQSCVPALDLDNSEPDESQAEQPDSNPEE